MRASSSLLLITFFALFAFATKFSQPIYERASIALNNSCDSIQISAQYQEQCLYHLALEHSGRDTFTSIRFRMDTLVLLDSLYLLDTTLTIRSMEDQSFEIVTNDTTQSNCLDSTLSNFPTYSGTDIIAFSLANCTDTNRINIEYLACDSTVCTDTLLLIKPKQNCVAEGAALIVCQTDTTVFLAEAFSSTVVDFAVPVDTCEHVIISCSPNAGSVFPCGITTVTCIATDTLNRIADTCFFDIIV
ncbi:MAG: hypothetical protein AAGI49_05485, partial [Bacteroidota bacterium]